MGNKVSSWQIIKNIKLTKKPREQKEKEIKKFIENFINEKELSKKSFLKTEMTFPKTGQMF